MYLCKIIVCGLAWASATSFLSLRKGFHATNVCPENSSIILRTPFEETSHEPRMCAQNENTKEISKLTLMTELYRVANRDNYEKSPMSHGH